MSAGIRLRAGRKREPVELLDKVRAYQVAARYEGLSSTERALLLVLVDKTIGWGRSHQTITNKELVRDVDLSARVLRRARTALENAGLIEVTFTGHANRYDMILPKRISRTPKPEPSIRATDLQTPEEAVPARPNRTQQGGQIGQGPNTDKPREGDEAVLEAVPPPVGGGHALTGEHTDSTQRAVARVRKRSADRRAEDIKTKGTLAVWRTWQLAHVENGYPEPIRWEGKGSGRWGGVAVNIIKTFPGDSAADLHAFVEWTVVEWNGRARECLSWMKDYPAAPSLDIIHRQMEKLIAEWRKPRSRRRNTGSLAQQWSGKHGIVRA